MKKRDVLTLGVVYIASDWTMDAILCYAPDPVDWLLLILSRVVIIGLGLWKWLKS